MIFEPSRTAQESRIEADNEGQIQIAFRRFSAHAFEERVSHSLG